MKNERPLRQLRFLLFSLVLVLTFEGLVRKKAPGVGKVVLFFLKDFVVGLIWICVLRVPKPREAKFLIYAYWTVAIFMVPVVIATALHDPLLAVFGVKQYLLFPIVGIATFVAYKDMPVESLISFLRRTAFLVIPTSLLALIQLRLPADHWLNLSVGGTSLEGFSASGLLRVSSTFPFVAQYTMFLNAQVFFVVVALYHLKGLTVWRKVLHLSLPFLLILGSYITGSRGAVLGDAAIVVLALGLIAMKGHAARAFQAGLLVALLYLAFLVVKELSPSSFAVYSEREQGQLIGVSSEIQHRVFDMLFGWMWGIPGAPASLIGYGLGVMSNGSDLLSSYAQSWRGEGSWTETDYSTTLFEGGFYLVAVWYAFRYFIIFETTRRFVTATSRDFVIPAAFCQGYVILTGVLATLAIQPPVAIWWWISVGTSLVFWYKSVETPGEEPPPDSEEPPTPLPTKILRGRSAYAEQLHSGK